MPTSRAILIGAVLVSIAVIGHAYLARPPRYALIQASRYALVEGTSGLMRLNTYTGEVVPCWPVMPSEGTTQLRCTTQEPH